MDYRDLLIKYIRHVADMEGVTFIDIRHRTGEMSPDEWAELERLVNEIRGINNE